MSYRPKDTQERILHRLKIAQGHLKKVIQMVEDDEYCIDILHQSQAIQRAIKEIDNLVLEQHLNHCVADSIRTGKLEKTIKELTELYKKIG